MITFCSLSQGRLIGRQAQPCRAGGKMLSVPQIKLVRHAHHHTKPVHAQRAPTPHADPTPEEHSAGASPHSLQHWPTRNASCLLKVGKKPDKDQVRFPLSFRFFAPILLRLCPHSPGFPPLFFLFYLILFIYLFIHSFIHLFGCPA